MLRRSQIFRSVAQQQFLLRGRARIHPRQPFEQPRLLQTAHHGIEALGPFRMFAPGEVLAEDRVGQQRGSWFHEEQYIRNIGEIRSLVAQAYDGIQVGGAVR